MSASANIVFMPSGQRGQVLQGTPVLDAARSLGVDVDSVCGGRGICGRCKVLVCEGEFSKHAITSSASHLSEFTTVEQRYSDKRQTLQAGQRLSCQAKVLGDLVIDVPPESQMHRQLVRKEAERRSIALETATRLYCIEVQPAELESSTGDFERVQIALRETFDLYGLSCHPSVLQLIQPALREGDWQVTVAVHQSERIVAVWPGYKDQAFGLAVDIGSTTIAGHLCDLGSGEVVASAGMMNPQIRFGEDLMSRVSYLLMKPDGREEMTQVVRAAVNQLITETVAAVDSDASHVLELSIAGNPIMHHLFLGLSPVELGTAPFALVTDAAIGQDAASLGLRTNPGAQVYVLPCIAGHVGADAAAMVLAEAPQTQAGVALVVDVGTNAEIVLSNNGKLLACSSPTGPAFEGAQISCGQRAAPGAIERVRIDAETLEPKFKVIGSDLWSDEPGFEAVVAKIGVSGICGSGIIEVIAEMYLAGVVDEDGVIDGSLAERSPRVIPDDRTFSYQLWHGERAIVISQNDVRQVQLAKAALYAGIKLLLSREGIETVDQVRLAGAFGAHIDTTYAMVLGLIPDCHLAQVSSAGNAAGTGARIALLNVSARREIEALVQRITKIETALEPGFQDFFVDAMAFPNKRDQFPLLFEQLARPRPSSASAKRGERGSRRRGRGTKSAVLTDAG